MCFWFFYSAYCCDYAAGYLGFSAIILAGISSLIGFITGLCCLKNKNVQPPKINRFSLAQLIISSIILAAFLCYMAYFLIGIADN